MPAGQLDRDNPWPGLESFEESARDYFHGREAEAEDLLRRVTDSPLTVLFGKSGLGKTSLLKAGLFPRLREKHFLPVHVRLDIRPEAPGLIDQLRDGLLAEIARERVDASALNAGETLWEYLHRADLELWSEQNYPLTPVLVLDQFEEVFTLGERLAERVERFKSDLGDLAENRIPAALASRLATDPSAAQGLDLRRMAYKLVVTLREDFLPHLEGWRPAVPSLGRVRVRLLPMRPEQALSAVYDTAPHLMDEPLARRIVAFVAAAAQGEGTGEIEPALLSLFCRGLNERRKRQGAERFDEHLLEGAQQSIIADYYRSCVEGLPDSVSRFIESELITEKGFRNSYAKDDAVPAYLSEEQLDRLINRRLLRIEERYGTARIELTHDLLTRAVMADRDRRRVEEERQALAAQARKERQRLLAMAVVAVVCLAFAGVATWQWWAAVTAKKVSDMAQSVAERAQKAAMKAERKATVAAKTAEQESIRAQTQARLAKESAEKEMIARGSAEARRMETEAQLVFRNSGDSLAKATLLAIASVRSAPTIDGQISLTKYLGVLPRTPLWRRSIGLANGNGPRQVAMAVSPDGMRVAVARVNSPVQIIDARTGKPLRSFKAPQESDRTMLAFSPDGASLVLSCGHQACVLDAANGELMARLPSAEGRHGDMVWSGSFSPDGKLLAMSSYHSHDVLLYDVATWHTVATVHAGDSDVFSVAFSGGGEWLATGTGSAVQLWRVGHYDAPAAHVRASAIPWSIAFRPDGEGLVVAGQELQAWDIVPGDGGVVRLEAAASRPIVAQTVLPLSWRGRGCLAAAASDAVHLLCGEKLQDEVLRIPMPSVAIALSPDGRRLVNQQPDGVLAAWPLNGGADTARVRLGAPVRSMALPEHAEWLAAGTDKGEVAIVNLESWKERRRLHLGAAPVDRIVTSSDGRWLVAAQGPSLHIFDSVNWREAASGTYAESVARTAFAAGDRWLVAVTGDTVVVWQSGGWRERLRLEHDGQVQDVKVSPNGNRLTTITHWTAGHDAGVNLTRVFDLASGKETGWQYTSGGGNISQPFMREEAARRNRALSGGDMASVREATTSWPALELKDPLERKSADGVWHADFGGHIVVLRDLRSGRLTGDFDHGSQITSVRFVPSVAPRWLVTGGEDSTLAVWPLRTDDLAREACARLRGLYDQKELAKRIADAHVEGTCGSR